MAKIARRFNGYRVEDPLKQVVKDLKVDDNWGGDDPSISDYVWGWYWWLCGKDDISYFKTRGGQSLGIVSMVHCEMGMLDAKGTYEDDD